MQNDLMKLLKRGEFSLQMADELMKPWLLERYNMVTLRHDSKSLLKIFLTSNSHRKAVFKRFQNQENCPPKKDV